MKYSLSFNSVGNFYSRLGYFLWGIPAVLKNATPPSTQVICKPSFCKQNSRGYIFKEQDTALLLLGTALLLFFSLFYFPNFSCCWRPQVSVDVICWKSGSKSLQCGGHTHPSSSFRKFYDLIHL